jgi:zinc/manganese transport system permease protein
MTFSWDLVADIQDMWSLPSMLNAFRAGTVVAVLAALIGWFMVLRRQSFAGHTLSVIGFPGAAAGVWLGLSAATGYFAACLAAAVGLAVLRVRSGRGYAQESAVIGTVQAFALAAGMLFVGLYKGFLTSTTTLLFGSFLGITEDQVLVLTCFAVLVLAVLAAVGRPLLFSSIDRDVARAHGVPTGRLDVVFLLLLGASAAAASQITGSLLVFALLVLPPATAQRITTRPAASLMLSVLFAVGTVWTALVIAFYSQHPIGFWLTTIAFGLYLVSVALPALGRRLVRPVLAGA